MTTPVAHPLAPFLQPARRWIRRTLLRLPTGLREFLLFGLKMAWSCLFGAAMLSLMIATHFIWPQHFPLYRYDTYNRFSYDINEFSPCPTRKEIERRIQKRTQRSLFTLFSNPIKLGLYDD